MKHTQFMYGLKTNPKVSDPQHSKTTFIKGLYLLLLLSFFVSLIPLQHTNAQSGFTAGRIVVVKTTGTGSKNSSAVTLQEYQTNGTTGTTITLPTSGATPIVMAAGSGGSEGFLTRSTDGQSLVLAGYTNDTVGIADITVTKSAATPRVIFKVDADGNYTQAGSSNTYYNANDIRGAISDGTNFWAAGASVTNADGINYYGPGTTAALSLNAKAYGLQIFNGQIYFSTQKTVAGVTPSLGIYAVGNGLPTSGTITPTLVFPTGTATPLDFSFNPGGNICYVAVNGPSSAAGIQKWTKSGSTWSLAYTLSTGGAAGIGAYGITVDYTGANPVIYATTTEANTTGNRIISITDVNSGSTATTLVAATANTFYHGIAFSPVKACSLPVQPDAFAVSNASPYKGQSGVTYTVPNDASVTYTWNYKGGTGATINGTGNSVTVDFSASATNGTLSVTATNSCGNSISRDISLTLTTLPGAIRITEYMYNGGGANGIGEFVEFTNVGGTDVDMTGWSFDDNTRIPGSQDLSAFGIVKAGESVILTELATADFRTNWKLCAGVKVIGGNSNGLGREDEINLYDASNAQVDRLTYGDQTYAAGSIRTTTKSGWVSAAGLGANTITQWTLASANDSEGSYASTLAEIGSPGKSTRAAVAYNPCTVVNGTPTIILDVTATTNYLDGGVTAAPASPFSVSGVISDPTDPASTSGLNFTVNDNGTATANLTVTVTSSNTTVVPAANVVLTGSDASRNVKITPAAVGYSNITVTVNDGTNNTSYIINYAASAASSTPANTVWHTGMSDASDAISLDDNFYISGDDELNVLNVYSRSNSGLPFVSYDYTSNLNLPVPSKPEVDLEAGTRSPVNTGKIYWIGSMSNSKAPFNDAPNRNRIFATNVTGTGVATSFSFSGYYGDLRNQIITWGDANGYGFSASAAAGSDSKSVSGFAVESMVFGPDNTTLFIGMRAPMVPNATRTKAVIVPISNFETWFNNGAPTGNPVIAAPIELDLGGRGFRDLIRMSNGTYVIVAGNSAGDPITSAIFKWSGNTTDAPILVNTSANNILNMEGVMAVNTGGKLAINKLQVISDGGDDVLYGDGTASKDFAALNMRKFRSDILSSIDLCLQNDNSCITTSINDQVIAGNQVNAYPNPFAGELNLDYTLTNTANLEIELIDVTGKQIAIVANQQNVQAGNYHLNLQAADYRLQNGLYLVKFKTAKTTQLIKVNYIQ